ncbi:thiol-disulfide oxidoreductase DCC family protein [Halomicroarcula sp. GCM10025709]|uniref:thiol-disulfide oxidoreductase DCC family protein n=1 Tax=Haloarcula TaxID=2237 RepID=UPI0024C427F7|nr:thiol-disulfide oxidoreductase DCC family protein [Halomicroarcula sp. YJ-61-S]
MSRTTDQPTLGPGYEDHGPVLLFDGVCNLCHGLVQTIVPRDPEGRLKFASLQSDYGQRVRAAHGLPTESLGSVVLVDGPDVYTKSRAVIRVAELLGWPYRLAAVGRLVPASISDTVYDFVAAHRYQWFGRKDQCMIPDTDISDRFVDDGITAESSGGT